MSFPEEHPRWKVKVLGPAYLYVDIPAKFTGVTDKELPMYGGGCILPERPRTWGIAQTQLGHLPSSWVKEVRLCSQA